MIIFNIKYTHSFESLGQLHFFSVLSVVLNFNFDNLEARGNCLTVSNNPFSYLIASAGCNGLSPRLRALTVDDSQQVSHTSVS